MLRTRSRSPSTPELEQSHTSRDSPVSPFMLPTTPPAELDPFLLAFVTPRTSTTRSTSDSRMPGSYDHTTNLEEDWDIDENSDEDWVAVSSSAVHGHEISEPEPGWLEVGRSSDDSDDGWHIVAAVTSVALHRDNNLPKLHAGTEVASTQLRSTREAADQPEPRPVTAIPPHPASRTAPAPPRPALVQPQAFPPPQSHRASYNLTSEPLEIEAMSMYESASEMWRPGDCDAAALSAE